MRRFFQSATVNTWISIAIRIGGLAILVPLVLMYLDLQKVLVWQLLSSIMAMVVWIDFGLTPTFSRFISTLRGGGSLQDLQQSVPTDASKHLLHFEDTTRSHLGTMICTSGLVYLAMALVGTVVIAIVGTLVIMGPIGALSNPIEGWKAWWFTLAAVPFALLNGNNTSILIGCDRITAMRRVESVLALFQILSTALVVVKTSDLTWIAASYSFWIVVGFVLQRWQRYRVLRDQEVITTKTNRYEFSPDVLRVVWAAGWRSGIGVLFSAGIVQGSGMIMPQIATAEVSAAYLLVLRLMSVASQVARAPFYSRLPGMAKANAMGDQCEMVAIAKHGLRLSLWTMVVGIFVVLFIFPQVLAWINGSVQTVPSNFLPMLSMAFFAERYGGMHMQIYTLSSHVIWHRLNGLTGVIILLVFSALLPLFGASALPAGMLIGYCLYFCPAVSRRSLAFIRQDRISFEYDTSLGPTLGVAICILLYFLVG